jgi:8-oxo-dGTP pyrophosphatase MutT (NUDIX family)
MWLLTRTARRCAGVGFACATTLLTYAQASGCDGAELERVPATPQPRKHRWLSAAAVDRAAAEASVTSVFVLLVHKPSLRDDGAEVADVAAKLSPQARERGFAVRLGTEKARAKDASLSHYTLKGVLGCRALMCLHWRGGLELPGGHRDEVAGTTESTLVAAERELLEETGIVLSPPLAWEQDAAAVMLNDDGRPRWVLFARALDAESFDRAVAAGPAASTYLSETYGNVAVHAILTHAPTSSEPGRVYGLPCTLNLAAPWQGTMLLQGLQAAGVLTAAEATEASDIAAGYYVRGGPWAGGGPPDGQQLKQR